MQRHILYIVNPISGNRNKQPVEALMRKKTEEAGIPFTIASSVASNDYSFLTQIIQEKNVTDVVIAGGDGTVNGVVQSLQGRSLRFGIIPMGSGNGLAFSAGIPKTVDAALDVALAGKCQPTDAFLVNDRFACMLCGFGFDAQVAHDFANDPRRGLTTYIRKIINHFFSAPVYLFQLKSGNEEFQTDAFFISVANSNQFGNNFTIAPKANLRDGLLDIVIITRQTRLGVLYDALMQVGGFIPLLQKEIGKSRGTVLYFQTDELVIENPMLAPMHIDGEPVETTRHIRIRVLKDHFLLICP